MKLSLKILIHAIFWIVFSGITIGFAINNYVDNDEGKNIPHIVINITWGLVIFYMFYFYFIKYFEKGQFVKYLIFSILASIAITIIFLPLHKLFYKSFPLFSYQYFGPPILGSFVLAQCGSLVRGFENWVVDIKIKTELENQNLKNELELLKSQINPHFLFNTLNNIDTLIHKAPNEASHSLITLSDMLRYMIYETKTDFVDLQKELNYIKKYIDLQKLRSNSDNFIQTNFPTNCENKTIAPMLLLPFVENAFKYASSTETKPAIIIKLTCTNEILLFECNNNYSETNAHKIHSGGMGLDNVKRRLDLIYPNKYALTILDENFIFDVKLKIELN